MQQHKYVLIKTILNVLQLVGMEHVQFGILSKLLFILLFKSYLKSINFYRRYARSQVLFANTLFQCIAFHPEEFHIITGGSDRKIAYWESYDGSQIRELEASKSGPINGLDVCAEGKIFVTGSSDKLVKVIFLILIFWLI